MSIYLKNLKKIQNLKRNNKLKFTLLTRNVIIHFDTESLMFFLTTLKYETIKFLIISVSVTSLFVGF
jgi:hypothetical protein